MVGENVIKKENVTKKNERWYVLCQQASVERDPAKLLALVTEINNLLEEKERSRESVDASWSLAADHESFMRAS